MGSELSRRQFVGAVGAGMAGSLLPPSVHRALAQPVRRGGLRAVEHVVILMQENRAFDQYFGTLRGVRGFGDRAALELPSGRPVYEQPNGAGTVLPFSVREAAQDENRPISEIQFIDDLDHSWDGGHQAWAGGWMNDWIAAKTAATMSFYDGQDLPFQYELARTFTICDAYHCSVLGATNPNRMYMWTGTVGYEPPPNETKRAVENDAYAEATHAGYDWTTYPERLEPAGVTWQTYMEWDNFQDNALEFFVVFKRIALKALAAVDGDVRSLDSFYNRVRAAPEAERRRLLAQLEEGVKRLDPAERRLYDRGLRRVEGRLADAFRADVDAGLLPQVSYIVPSAADSEHPCCSSPAASASLTYEILDALASNLDVWSSTVLLINFDENDGYFDHVPPPVPPPEADDEYYAGLPIGFGFRVPMFVISPWSAGGFVCSQTFDHTSVVRLLETWLDVEEPNIGPWRRRVAGDLTSAFDFETAGRRPSVAEPPPPPPDAGRWLPAPPAAQEMPTQEPGRQPARPLPYQPDAAARLDHERRRLTVKLTNAGRESVHLALYPYAGELAAPKHLDVRRAHTESLPLAGDRYRVTVAGPNGFHRTFAGDVRGAAEVSTELEAHSRRLHITLRNDGRSPLTFLVNERRVTVRPRRERTIEWRTSDGWYDVTITTAEDAAFLRRLAGHIENGRPSVTG